MCFIVTIDADALRPHPIRWNPWNKVVHDHRDGSILPLATELERRKRNLPVPWTPEMGARECREPAIS